MLWSVRRKESDRVVYVDEHRIRSPLVSCLPPLPTRAPTEMEKQERVPVHRLRTFFARDAGLGVGSPPFLLLVAHGAQLHSLRYPQSTASVRT